MNPKKYPRLVLLLTAIVTVMCRCSLPNYTDITVKQTQGEPARCFYEDYWWENGALFGYETTCNINCPNGKIKQVTFPGPSIPELIITEDYCTTPATAQPSPTATSTPAATVTAPAASAPLLTGDVTACSVKDGYLNFKMVDRSVQGSIHVEINGKTVTCSVVGTNGRVLSCALPAGVTFPIMIMAAEDLVATDSFSYDGQGCGVEAPKQDSDSGGGGTCVGDPPCP